MISQVSFIPHHHHTYHHFHLTNKEIPFISLPTVRCRSNPVFESVSLAVL